MAVATSIEQSVRRYVDAINSADDSAIDDVIDEQFVMYDPTETEPIRGREGFRRYLRTYRSAMPDFRFEVDDMLISGDRAALHWRVTGTHRGELEGIQPTGERVTVEGMEIDRFHDGRLAETSQIWDTLGLLRQIGAASNGGR